MKLVNLPTGKTLFVSAGIKAALLVDRGRECEMQFADAPAALAWCMQNRANMVYICQPPAAHQ